MQAAVVSLQHAMASTGQRLPLHVEPNHGNRPLVEVQVAAGTMVQVPSSWQQAPSLGQSVGVHAGSGIGVVCEGQPAEPTTVQAPVLSLQQVVVGQKEVVQVEPTPPWLPVQLAAAV